MRDLFYTGIIHNWKRVLLVCSLLGIISLLILPPKNAQGGKAEPGQSSQLQAVDHYLDEAIRKLGVPGGSVALVYQGEQVYSRSWGITGESEQTVTNETPFLIGSLSKTLTAYGIMRLVDEGKVQLDVPVQQYLPWFSLPDDKEASQITIHQLLTQTSGMSESAGMNIADQGASDQLAIQRTVRALAKEPLEAASGNRHIYSNANYAVLGAVIEEVSGMTYAEFMESSIFSSLDMEHSAATIRQAEARGWEPGFRSWLGLSIPSPIPYDNGGAPYGYVVSSSSDLAKFLIAMQDPGKVITADRTKELIQPAVSVRANHYYGYGWRITQTDTGETRIWHAGSTPDARSEMVWLPESGWGIVLLTNQNNRLEEARLSIVAKGIQDILLGSEATPISFPPIMERWLAVGGVLVLMAITVWLLTSFRRGMETKLRRWVWFTLGGVFFSLAGLIIPVLLYLTQVSWHTVSLFVPDLAEMVLLMVIFLSMNGVLSLIKASTIPSTKDIQKS